MRKTTNTMKTKTVFLILLAIAVSCSSNNNQETADEIIPKASSTVSVTASDTSTSGTETEAEEEPIASVIPEADSTIPEAYSKFNLDIIDADSLFTDDADTLSADIELVDSTDNNQYRKAFKTGISFGSAHREHHSTRERFKEIILKNEQKGDASSAAIMIAGKYFKMIQRCADRNIDERRLKEAIDGLENLRNYINEALQSNKDVSTNLILQKISDNTIACRTVFEKCNEEYNGQADKYRNLADTISIMQKNLFAD